MRVPMGGMGAQFLSTATGDPERIYDSRDDPVNGDLPFEDGDWQASSPTPGTARPRRDGGQGLRSHHHRGERGTASGYLTAWAGGVSPTAGSVSTVNYIKGTVAPNMTVVPAGH